MIYFFTSNALFQELLKYFTENRECYYGIKALKNRSIQVTYSQTHSFFYFSRNPAAHWTLISDQLKKKLNYFIVLRGRTWSVMWLTVVW